MAKVPLILLLHNIRSAYNVGAIFRSADGFAVERIICSGYTPYPKLADDRRLPHISTQATTKIAKTALGAEQSVKAEHQPDGLRVISHYRQVGYQILALEQCPASTPLYQFKLRQPSLLILGEELGGIPTDLLKQADTILEIPLMGLKESLNVANAAAIALYQLRQA